jgi:hypothetical protein
VVFDNIVRDGLALASFWARFNVHVRHGRSPGVVLLRPTIRVNGAL